jgi:hypothetical protein
MKTIKIDNHYIDLYIEEKPEYYVGNPSITINVKSNEKNDIVKIITELLEGKY